MPKYKFIVINRIGAEFELLSWALRSRSPPSVPVDPSRQLLDYIQLVVRGRSDPFAPSQTARVVESRCGAVAVGPSHLLPPLSSGGVAIDEPWLRFHIPLIEPDGPTKASGSRTSTHAFAHGRLRVRAGSRIRPRVS